MLACSLAAWSLVFGAGAEQRLAPPDGAAVPAAVDLAVVAHGANADFALAARASEETMALDHLSLRR